MEKLRPFRFWCQKVLPLVYDDSLSYYELLCKVINYLNSLVTDTNSLIDNVEALNAQMNRLQEYVNTYFDSLDVQAEVDNKLDEMAGAGELDVLLRGCDFLEEMLIHPLGFYSNGLQPQGSERYTYNDVTYIAVAFSAEDENNDQVVIFDASTLAVVNEISGNFGHCNGMAYYNGKLYIARGGGNATRTNEINIIDLSDFTISSITTGYPIFAIAYQGGNFYCLGSLQSRAVYLFDTSFNYLSQIRIEYVGANQWQGMMVDQLYIYIVNYRGSGDQGIDGIGVYFKNGKQKAFVKALTNLEIEDISANGFNFSMTAFTGGGCLFFSAKLNASVANLGRLSNMHDLKMPTADKSVVFYVDKTYNGTRQDGTQARPFSSWTLLVQSALFKAYSTITIHFKGDFSDTDIFLPTLEGLRTVHFIGDDYETDGATVKSVIASIRIGAGYNVEIENLKFTGFIDNRGAVSLKNVNLYMTGCAFESSNNGLYMEACTGTIVNTSFNGNAVGITTIRNCAVNLGQDVTFTNCTQNAAILSPMRAPYLRIAGFGDSIMAGTHNRTNMLVMMSEEIGCKVINMAVSGGRYDAGNLSVKYQLENTDPDSFDIGIIWAGTNDFGNDRPLEDFNNALDQTFAYIKETFPGKLFLACTPIPRSEFRNGLDINMAAYVDAIIEKGAAYGVAVYDSYRDPVMNMVNDTAFMPDGLHPSDAGLRKIYPSILHKFI